MAEKNTVDWRDTMGEPFEEAENPEYDVSVIKKTTTDTPAHAEMFNSIFQHFINNIAAVKKLAESKAAQVPEFEEAETLENIQSGDSMPGILGKLKKWYASLHRVAWSGKYGDLENIPSAFPPVSHDHDDQYYTESEMDALLAGKSDTTHTHTATQVGAAASNHTHNYAGSQTPGGPADNAKSLNGISADNYATKEWVQQSQSVYMRIRLSNTGDDATADGTANKPFKTMGAALKMYLYPKIRFYIDEDYTFSESITIANRCILFEGSTNATTWHMKGSIYLYNSMLGWQKCVVNWYQGYAHIRPQGVCSFMLGDFYNVTFSALAQNGGTATDYVTVITANNTDVNDWLKTQSPFMAATSYRFTLGEKLRLFSSGFGAAIVLWRPIQSTISDGAYLYNNSTGMDQIGTSGVYVLK